jgi:hypothetical protein
VEPLAISLFLVNECNYKVNFLLHLLYSGLPIGWTIEGLVRDHVVLAGRVSKEDSPVQCACLDLLDFFSCELAYSLAILPQLVLFSYPVPVFETVKAVKRIVPAVV